MNGKIYGLSGSNGLEVSTDGLNWSALSLPSSCASSIQLVTIAGNGQSQLVVLGNSFVFGNTNKCAFMSADGGQTWSEQNLNLSNNPIALVFGNNEYVGITSSSIITSQDGINWNVQPVNGSSATGLGYGNGLFIVATDNGTILTSTDGANWKQDTITPVMDTQGHSIIPVLNKIVWDGKEYLALGGSNYGESYWMPYQSSVWVSDDGSNWYPEILPPPLGSRLSRSE